MKHSLCVMDCIFPDQQISTLRELSIHRTNIEHNDIKFLLNPELESISLLYSAEIDPQA